MHRSRSCQRIVRRVAACLAVEAARSRCRRRERIDLERRPSGHQGRASTRRRRGRIDRSTARMGVKATGAQFDTARARFDLHGRALEMAVMETVELGRHRSCGVPQATRSGAMAWTRRCGAPVVAAPSSGSDELD
jgi:hypothetical protein